MSLNPKKKKAADANKMLVIVGLVIVIALGLYVGFAMSQGCSKCSLKQDKTISALKGNISEDLLPLPTPPSGIPSNDSLQVEGEVNQTRDTPSNYSKPATPALDETLDNKTVENETALYSGSLVLFWAIGCPHCAAEKEFLLNVKKEYPQLEISMYEVNHNESNFDIMDEWCSKWGARCGEVPVTFIGDKVFTSFRDYEGDLVWHSTERAYVGYKNQIEKKILEVLNGT